MRQDLLRLTVALALTVGLGVALVLRWHGGVEGFGKATGSETARFDPPAPVPADGEYVQSRVLPSGDLEVQHWIRSSVPIFQVTLSLPDVLRHDPNAAARQVRVESGGQGQLSSGPVTTRPETFYFTGTSTLHIAYVLSGSVVRSRSAPGRALVRATSLDLARTPSHGPRTVHVTGVRVRAAACTPESADAEPRPCGDADGTSWRVDLADRERRDQVLAQVDLA